MRTDKRPVIVLCDGTWQVRARDTDLWPDEGCSTAQDALGDTTLTSSATNVWRIHQAVSGFSDGKANVRS